MGKMVRHIGLEFRTELDKAVYLDAQAHTHDQKSLLVAEKARLFTSFQSPLSALQALHRYVRDTIKYQHDPNGKEQFADADTVLSRGFDDCDGKARTVVALATSLGRMRPDWQIEARTVPHWRDNHFAHVSAEIRFVGSGAHPRADAKGFLCSDTIVGGLELGMVPSDARDPRTGKIPTV